MKKAAYFVALLALLLNPSHVSAGEVVFETLINQFQWWSEMNWGISGFTNVSYVSVGYTPSSNQEICTIKAGLYKVGNPTDEVTLRINDPSLAISMANVPASEVSGPPFLPQQTVYTTFQLPSCLNLIAGTRYFFTFQRTQIGSGGNYAYQISNLISYPQTTFWTHVPVQGFTERPGYEPAFRLEGPEETKTPVLIIPGIAGSELNNGEDLIWPNLTEMIFDLNDDKFLTDNLALDSSGNSINLISVGDAVKRIPRVPVLDTNIFENLEEILLSQFYILNEDLFFFPYDWRLNLDNTKDLLNDKIETIKQQTGSEKVNIIAHSMGGLLTKDYIHTYGKDSVDKLIFVGTPHLGAPKAGKVIIAGENFGIPWLEDERLKELAKNSPAVHQLLPNQVYFDSFSGYIQKSGEGSLLNYQDTKNFLVEQNSSELIMGLAENFWSKNLAEIDLSGINVYNFSGCSSGTQAGYRLKSDNISISEIGRTSGDQTVPLVSSDYLNIPQENKFYLKKANHAEMPSQEDVRSAILKILNDQEVQTTGNLKVSSNECDFKGKTLTWHSPVGVHIYDNYGHHTGPIENGIEYGILGVDYEIIGHDKFIYLPTDNGEIYNIVADGLATGSFDLIISNNNNGIVESSIVFNDVAIGENSDVDFSISNSTSDTGINVDFYGNDIVQNVIASSILTGDDVLDSVSPETEIVISGNTGNDNWYLGDVNISLSATDDNSGILEIRYSLDGQPFLNYDGTINVRDEGLHTLLYYSVDRAGNNEETKGISFGIDMTSLEILVAFDLDIEALSYLPIGDDSDIISFACDSSSCVAIDRAGNITKLEFVFEEKGRKQVLNFKSITYNGIRYELPDNQFTVKLWEKNDELKDFDQVYLVKKEEKLKIDYKLKRDESVIVHKLIPGKPARETVSGKHFLQLFTNKGKMEYIINQSGY